MPGGAARGMSERALDAARDERADRAGRAAARAALGRRRTRCACSTWPCGSGRTVSRAARELRAARGCRRPTRSSAAGSASRSDVPLHVRAGRRSAPRATSRSGARRPLRAGRAARRRRLRRRRTPPPTRPRPCSTGSPSRPGSRALLGMAPRRGRLVRPLLEVTREEVRDYLPRARAGVARGPVERRPPLRARACAPRGAGRAARAVAGGGAHDRRDRAPAARRGRGAGRRGGRRPRGAGRRARRCRSAALRELPAGLRAARAARLAERRGGDALRARELDEILALGERGTKSLDLGGGLRAVAEYGTLRFTRASRTPARPRRSRCRSPAAPASATGSGGAPRTAGRRGGRRTSAPP